jgi:hypothetical protein
MLRLRRALIFLLGVSIPFSNLAISFAGRNWSFGLIASVGFLIAIHLAHVVWAQYNWRVSHYMHE